MKDLAVIIVNWNVKSFLNNCLSSLRREIKDKDWPVLVIDNASDDGSVNLVKKKYPWVTLVENKRNVGFANANNQAINTIEANYYLLLNPDTLVTSGTISKIKEFMDKNHEVGICGSKLLMGNGKVQKSAYDFPTWWNTSRSYGLDTLLYKIIDKLIDLLKMKKKGKADYHEVDWLIGAFFFIRRRVIEEIGFLDESFFFTGEEIDWCYRAKKRNWKVVYIPDVKVYHFTSQSSKKKWKRSDRIKIEWASLFYFIKKNYNFSHLILTRCFTFFNSLYHFSKRLIFYIVGRDKVRHKDMLKWYLNILQISITPFKSLFSIHSQQRTE